MGIDFKTAAPGTVFMWSRRYVDPLNLSPDDVDIVDIAHSLSRQCRYNGHCGGFMSVARHSLWVSETLYGYDSQMQLWGLLHDASEAYIGDMVSPLKRSTEMQIFREVEDRIHEAIAEHFGLPWPMPTEVNDADFWVFENIERVLLEDFDSSYKADEFDFMERFNALTGV